MRDIRFRAWDKNSKLMIYDYFLITYDGIPMEINGITPRNELILMQYTGLLDHNGEEIYEGDIIQWTHDFKQIFEVKWEEKIAGFNFPWKDNDDLEIIGNIWESPELLK